MFLLVPAHPGCPGQIPQSRKTVVCVCVCVCALIALTVVLRRFVAYSLLTFRRPLVIFIKPANGQFGLLFETIVLMHVSILDGCLELREWWIEYERTTKQVELGLHCCYFC